MLYKRKGEESVKECIDWSCRTVWKDSWLEIYQDKDRCPICGQKFEPSRVTELEPIKRKELSKETIKVISVRLREHRMYLEQLTLAEKEIENENEDWTNQ